MAVSGTPSATFGGRARARRPHPRPGVPTRDALDQRRVAADGPAARPAGARRVLRRLPRALAAHPAVRAGVARALRRRRAAGRSIHAPGHAPALDEEVVRASVERLGIEHAVGLDHDFHLWHDYGNKGWPARYLFTGESRLLEYHYGLGGYDETELAIQELLGIERDLVAPLRPQDAPGADLVAPTADQEGAWSGPYEAGAVWAVLEGAGTVDGQRRGPRDRLDRRPRAAGAPGAHRGRSRSSSPARASPATPCSSSRAPTVVGHHGALRVEARHDA